MPRQYNKARQAPMKDNVRIEATNHTQWIHGIPRRGVLLDIYQANTKGYEAINNSWIGFVWISSPRFGRTFVIPSHDGMLKFIA